MVNSQSLRTCRRMLLPTNFRIKMRFSCQRFNFKISSLKTVSHNADTQITSRVISF